MLITVTQEHIDKGIREDECFCPIALALKERFKVDYAEALIGVCTIGRFPDDVIGKNIPYPQEVNDFIIEFDKGKPVTPFSFELDLSGGVDNG